MLYVGFLEAPFRQAKYVTLITVITVFLAVTMISVPIFLRWASGIFRPLEKVTGTIEQVEAGDLGARTGLVAQDEIARVGRHLDELLDAVQIRDRQMRDWNEELNQRVAERTRELQLANRQLEATSKQLVMSEKLAAIGEITAGVAHEINNPIAVMQGNLDVIRSVMEDRIDDVRTEFRLVDEQIHRINLIVTRLLQFARPEEYAGYVDRSLPAQIIEDTLPLVRHLLDKAAIELTCDHAATRSILMNRTELQQVLVNLIVNAIHAMPDGGKLSIADRDEDDDDISGLAITVSDTGTGIDPAVVDRIFDPFFTTKRSEGTGLGLSISQSLISRQGGRITVESHSGLGTTFTIHMPQAGE